MFKKKIINYFFLKTWHWQLNIHLLKRCWVLDSLGQVLSCFFYVNSKIVFSRSGSVLGLWLFRLKVTSVYRFLTFEEYQRFSRSSTSFILICCKTLFIGSHYDPVVLCSDHKVRDVETYSTFTAVLQCKKISLKCTISVVMKKPGTINNCLLIMLQNILLHRVHYILIWNLWSISVEPQLSFFFYNFHSF